MAVWLTPANTILLGEKGSHLGAESEACPAPGRALQDGPPGIQPPSPDKGLPGPGR